MCNLANIIKHFKKKDIQKKIDKTKEKARQNKFIKLINLFFEKIIKKYANIL